MDATTAAIMMILDINPNASINIETIRKDVEKRGEMTTAEIRRYAEQYLNGQKDNAVSIRTTNIQGEAEKYYNEKKAQFDRFKRNWEALAKEIPEKFRTHLANGLHTDLSSDRSGSPGTLSVNLSFSMDTESAKRYLLDAVNQIKKLANDCEEKIKEIDRRIDGFQRDGFSANDSKRLINLLNDWINYMDNSAVEMGSHSIGFELSDEIKEIRNKRGTNSRSSAKSSVTATSTSRFQRNNVGVQKQTRTEVKSDREMYYDLLDRQVKSGLIDLEEELQMMEQYDRDHPDFGSGTKGQYRTAYHQWEKDIKTATRDRDKKINEFIQEETQRIINSVDLEKNQEIEEKRKIISNLEDEIKETETQLASTSFFSFKEKKEKKNHIRQIRDMIAENENAIESVESKANEKKAFAPRMAEQSRQIEEIRNSNPLPEEPEKPKVIIDEIDKWTKKFKDEGIDISSEVLNKFVARDYLEKIDNNKRLSEMMGMLKYMSDWEEHTLPEISQNVPQLAQLSQYAVADVFQQLEKRHVIYKNKRSYRNITFTLW